MSDAPVAPRSAAEVPIDVPAEDHVHVEVERSPADVLRLVVAVVLLVVATLLSRVFGATSSQFVADVLEGFQHLPAWHLLVVRAARPVHPQHGLGGQGTDLQTQAYFQCARG